MLYLADTSAWHRSAHSEVAEAWARRLSDDTLATCSPVRLEILYSARSGEDYDRIAAITGQSVEWIAPRGSL